MNDTADMLIEMESHLIQAVSQNRWNRQILARIAQLGFADWWLTGGCISQPVWNLACGRDVHAGIRDYDVFYFDADVSWAAENAIIERAQQLFADIPAEIQIRNQARVPLWYEAKFGIPYGQVKQASDGIDRFPCATVAIGVRQCAQEFEVYAPFGLTGLFEGILKPNRTLPIPHVYAEKIQRWQSEWPHLQCEAW